MLQEMPTQQLFFEKERCRGKHSFQMIKWDLETNTFVEGQWLLNKKICTTACSISPNGEYFGWLYIKYHHCFDGDNGTHAGISLVPHFTAILYGNKGVGTHLRVNFDEQGNPIDNQGFEQKHPEMLLPISCSKIPIESGLQEAQFISKTGQHVVVDGYKLMVDDVVLYDAADNCFVR